MNTVESDLVYGVGSEFELDSHEVLDQCFGIVRWVFGDIGKDQVITHASGLNVQYGFFHYFVFFCDQVHFFLECFDRGLEGVVGLF